MEVRAERRAEIAEDRLRGRLLDPEASKPGHKKVKGRTRGSKIAYKGTHKPAEAPTLRRDPPAYEKMAIMRRWERAKDRGCSVKGLPSEAKQDLERMWAWTRETVLSWFAKKDKILEAIARLKLGKTGLRPFGSNARLDRNQNRNRGARLQEARTGIPSRRQPLEGVMWRLKALFDKERAHGHEVRKKHILARLRYELELERDRQLALQQHEDERFWAWR